MRRNLLLVGAFLFSVFLCVNSFNKIVSLKTTSQNVQDQEAKLEQLKKENQALKQELDYKRSQKFMEEQIRDKLGLAKEGEDVFAISNREENSEGGTVNKRQLPVWKKWQRLVFGNV